MLHAGCSLYREHLHHTDPLCTHSALLGGILYSAPALCIPYDSFFGLSYLYWASFCILHLHPALYSIRSLLAVGEFLHSASCILHPARLSQLYLWGRFCILHPASASCIGGSSQLWGRFCILHSPSASCIGYDQFTALGPLLHSAHTHTHRSPTRTGPCTLNAVGLLSLDVETRGLPPLAPPPRVCGEVYLTLPYLTSLKPEGWPVYRLPVDRVDGRPFGRRVYHESTAVYR